MTRARNEFKITVLKSPLKEGRVEFAIQKKTFAYFIQINNEINQVNKIKIQYFYNTVANMDSIKLTQIKRLFHIIIA